MDDLFEFCGAPPAVEAIGPFDSDVMRQWKEQGVVVLPSLFSAEEVAAFVKARAANPQWAVIANPYTRAPEVRDLFCHPMLAKVLKTLFGQPAGLHLTLLGWYSSERDWHADIYLNPPHVVSAYAAVWIALEKVHPDSGPFQYVAGSHKWPALSQEKVRTAIHAAGMDAEAPSWPYDSERLLTPLYEKKFVELGVAPTTYLPDVGDVLIWHSNLAHRGSKAIDPSRQRLAAIGHYSGIHLRNDMPAAQRHGDGGWYSPIG